LKAIVLVSADAEWQAVKSLFDASKILRSPLGEHIEIKAEGYSATAFHGGWGRVSAAATTQYVIDRWQPELLVNLGTCGGFEGRIRRGDILLVERTVIYDILEQMTDAESAIQHYSTELDLGWLGQHLPTPVVRGLLVSGDRDIVSGEINTLVAKYGAVAADWESGAIAWVAKRNRARLLILRGVSDLVGLAGGEAYGDYELFVVRTREIMTRLFQALPKWLEMAESAPVG
jgi:adenosylhomocysteine nucleosidase